MNINIETLVGKTLIKCTQFEVEEIVFETTDGEVYKLFHDQDCCESVTINDVCGDLNDLVGSPIVQAEESSNSDTPPDHCHDSFTWTFYRLATAKGQVVIRWLGESNGYYSEAVNFEKVNP